jgi:hypothetical protein
MNTSPYDSLLLVRGPETPVEGWKQIRTLGELRKRCACWTVYGARCLNGSVAVYWEAGRGTFGLKLVEGLWVFSFCEDVAVYERIFQGLGGDYRLALC